MPKVTESAKILDSGEHRFRETALESTYLETSEGLWVLAWKKGKKNQKEGETPVIQLSGRHQAPVHESSVILWHQSDGWQHRVNNGSDKGFKGDSSFCYVISCGPCN